MRTTSSSPSTQSQQSRGIVYLVLGIARQVLGLLLGLNQVGLGLVSLLVHLLAGGRDEGRPLAVLPVPDDIFGFCYCSLDAM